jgi:hypothetical protein
MSWVWGAMVTVVNCGRDYTTNRVDDHHLSKKGKKKSQWETRRIQAKVVGRGSRVILKRAVGSDC